MEAVCVGGHCCGSGLCRRSLLWKWFVSAVIVVEAVCVGGHCFGSGLCRRSLLW